MDEVGRQDLVHLLGTANYGYGIVWREGGRMNPYLFTNGMVAAAARLGGRVFGDSPVQSCVREGNMWRVKSPEGSILARRVVVCTAGEHNQFFPELGRSNYPLVASALATRPLPSELIRQLMPSGLIVEQYPGLYHMLIDGRGRLVSSTIPAVGTAYDADMYFKIFVSWLRKSFPVASDFNIELESYWSGRMFNTSHVYQRGYPGVYRLDNGAYAFINLGSWGNFMGPLLGKSLGQALAADRPDDFVMPIDSPPRVSWPGYFDLKVRRFMVPAGRMADRLGLI